MKIAKNIGQGTDTCEPCPEGTTSVPGATSVADCKAVE